MIFVFHEMIMIENTDRADRLPEYCIAGLWVNSARIRKNESVF